ncbi:hypothetical protein BGZ83_001195 [Gryganskiella cystojenkinii]|nr:hypothetical protein BGZ83_001195 [Gryganskiella cystojenkinii]
MWLLSESIRNRVSAPLLSVDEEAANSNCSSSSSPTHPHPQKPGLGSRGRAAFGFMVLLSVTVFFLTEYSIYLRRIFHKALTVETDQEPKSDQYNTATCGRLDAPFEFESPPDFTKLGIESYTECREVKATIGWKVEHCTAPGSTWVDDIDLMEDDADSRNDGDNDKSHDGDKFLFRPKERPVGQRYHYVLPPVSVTLDDTGSLQDRMGVAASAIRIRQKEKSRLCNPGGYFRIHRLWEPSTNYTYGSDHPIPAMRCRNKYERPIALWEATRDYADNFSGPATFRVVLDGPELYITNQQINLGNCTYAIPYVLSRPGTFWLVQIEHGRDDFQALIENFDNDFIPTFKGDFILPQIGRRPFASGDPKLVQAFEEKLLSIYDFSVCTGCPQYLDPASQPLYEEWPPCSIEPLKAAREYGVYARSRIAQSYKDLLENKEFEWVAARPSCRHDPRLYMLKSPDTKPILNGESHTNETKVRVYGSPPPLPATAEILEDAQIEPTKCLSRSRSLYMAGDAHLRQLLVEVLIRLGTKDAPGEVISSEHVSTHNVKFGGVSVLQHYDVWIEEFPKMLLSMLDPSYDPFKESNQDIPVDSLERFDTLVLNFGAWASSGFNLGTLWVTDRFVTYMRKLLWDLGSLRDQRRKRFQQTGFGHKDLSIIWMSQVPWPDMSPDPDMRSNPRLQYWDDLTNLLIAEVNNHYQDQGGMIDVLDVIPKYLPYRKLSHDAIHFTMKETVDSAVQVLIHKLDLCREPFTPKFPSVLSLSSTAAPSPPPAPLPEVTTPEPEPGTIPAPPPALTAPEPEPETIPAPTVELAAEAAAAEPQLLSVWSVAPPIAS